ncbi:XLF-domain-containing protein [Macroventuria anomochaeta]|uniref:XLF-domain-containing protein n=1 Tax=Macroventuria anomochaeta TaxID=301207 RepID=A0ACB6RMY4_9PLEO|nr:XLF-domain-containing protein [Macroventuria anomochaeta]KAF2623072.1 XLF-domain-containing protein [Macroventuria anomochaeta]
MSSWRVLELSEQPDGEPIPQLLVKPAFMSDSYTVHLTCLTNIWSEQLDLTSIVDRAVEQQSPIEVSKQDTAQLAILLDNVKNSLGSSDDAECRLTREGNDNITLHTAIRLPAPLDSLTWKFHLQKRTSVTLKNELILPLLVSSHIQYERINDLVTTIENKDKAITRMVDQFESSNLDLAAAFPSIGGLKTGRRLIKREQAARHLPALRPFQHAVWREETAQLADSDVTTLGLFQEALVQCTPDVPLSLVAEDGVEDWLSAVPSQLTYAKPAIKIRTRELAPVFQPPKHGHESSPVDDDTEDEFEVHENFKTRNIPKKFTKAPEPMPPSAQRNRGADDEYSTEDDKCLDAPSRSQSQSRTHSRAPRQTRQRTKPPSPKASAEPATSPPPVNRSKGKGFRIGGKAKRETPETRSNEEIVPQESTRASMPPPSQVDSQGDASPKKPKKPFRIGGKSKASQEAASLQHDITASSKTTRVRDVNSPTPKSSPPPMPQEVQKEVTPVKEVHEETPEEKAERKRAELKRRNEEITKKQAQHKKKKRF